MTAIVLETLPEFHRRGFAALAKAWIALAAMGALGLLLVLPPGDNPGAGHMEFDPRTGEHRFVHDWTPAELVGTGTGVAAGYLLLASPLLAYRYPIGFLIRARVRTTIHVWAGVGVLVLSAVHAVILPLVQFYQGWLSGLVSLGLLAFHGACGAYKTRLVNEWGAARWRYVHVTTAWAGLTAGLVHSIGIGWLAHGGPFT